jgi:hypothetical protein
VDTVNLAHALHKADRALLLSALHRLREHTGHAVNDSRAKILPSSKETYVRQVRQRDAEP